jgi:hypothetical protein
VAEHGFTGTYTAVLRAERPALQPLLLTLPHPFDVQVHRRLVATGVAIF